MQTGWQDQVLSFWFDELTAEDWFKGGQDLDATIRSRYESLYEEVRNELDPKTISDEKTALAAVIVLDQFPRNMFRGEAAAFGTDNMAIQIARTAVDQDMDQRLSAEQKQFLYMPFMHSEISADQERCVDLFRALGNENGLDYAIEHRDIIQKFGRFPHRNRALGRDTSEDEQRFMDGHEGYGQ